MSERDALLSRVSAQREALEDELEEQMKLCDRENDKLEALQRKARRLVDAENSLKNLPEDLC